MNPNFINRWANIFHPKHIYLNLLCNPKFCFLSKPNHLHPWCIQLYMHNQVAKKSGARGRRRNQARTKVTWALIKSAF